MPVLYQGKMIAGNNTGGVSDIQTKLEGSPGQVVGFDASGNATAIQGWSNPNLLVNWDFRNPINSQGKTTYSDGVSGPAIDSWYCIRYGTGVTGNVSINNGYMTINCTAGNENAFVDVRQTLDLSCIKSNTPYTFSVLTQSGLYTITLPANGRYVDKLFDTNTILYIEKSSTNTEWNCIFRVLVGGAHNMIAAKFEEGTVQTLAHKVGDTWILNDVAPCLPIEMLRMGYRWCNPNLLDNWYFVNPVNQRGQTEYTGGGYTIDRWSSYSKTPTVNVTDSGITIGYGDWGQPLELSRFQLGTYTISALTSTGVLASSTFNISSLTPKTDIITPFGGGTNLYLRFIIPWIKCGLMFITNASETESVPIVAAKLELGPIQTLAHQENGIWVLNEIPDYGEELRKCQRYFFNGFHGADKEWAVIGTGFGWTRSDTTMAEIFIPVPVTMRAVPAISAKNLVLSGSIPVTKIEYNNSRQGLICVSAFASNLVQGTPYALQRHDESGVFTLSADL